MVTMRTNKARRAGASIGVALLLGVMAGCGSGGDSDVPSDSTVLTKNAALNNCTSVISGSRPSAGVTIPRCIPSTTAKRP